MLKALRLWPLVEERAALTPDRELAVDESGRRMTFGEYRAACERVAAGLEARGVGAGTRVSWQLPAWNESLVLVGALSRLGAVQNPIIPIYRSREVGFIASQLEPRLLIVPSVWRGFDYASMAQEIAADRPGLEILVADRGLPEADSAGTPAASGPADDEQEAPVRWVFYTSGTTGDPKGALHTDKTVIAATLGTIEALEISEDDRGGLVFPLTHIGGILSLVGSLLTGSATIVVEAFDETTIPLLAREGVTIGNAGTPFHLAYLHAQRQQPNVPLFPHARVYPGGGMPKPPQLHYDVKRELGGVGVVSGYGLTECPVLAMNTIRERDDAKLAETEGRPIRGVEVRVVTLDGAPAGPGEEGELHVRGPMLFRGYLDSSLDAEAFDDEGFLRTGDLGLQDRDGYLVITGRVKDIIIRKGENISARELEDLLYTHPRVADVAVIGVPDPELGERCCAVVVSSDPAAPLGFDQMSTFLREQGLMLQKLPEQLELVDEIPRNPTGKIQKNVLRERFSAA
ncbi:MAG: AMP-binding protein [Acidimicrobiia bacterium]